MATYFKNVLMAELGTTETTVLTSPNNARLTVIGLSLTNLTSNVVLASVRVLNNDTSDTAYYIKEVPVPANQSLRVVNGGERLVLGANTSVLIESSQNSSMDLVLSYVEIV